MPLPTALFMDWVTQIKRFPRNLTKCLPKLVKFSQLPVWRLKQEVGVYRQKYNNQHKQSGKPLQPVEIQKLEADGINDLIW